MSINANPILFEYITSYIAIHGPSSIKRIAAALMESDFNIQQILSDWADVFYVINQSCIPGTEKYGLKYPPKPFVIYDELSEADNKTNPVLSASSDDDLSDAEFSNSNSSFGSDSKLNASSELDSDSESTSDYSNAKSSDSDSE